MLQITSLLMTIMRLTALFSFINNQFVNQSLAITEKDMAYTRYRHSLPKKEVASLLTCTNLIFMKDQAPKWGPSGYPACNHNALHNTSYGPVQDNAQPMMDNLQVVTVGQIADKGKIAKEITKQTKIDANDFLKLLNDSTTVAKYGFNVENILTLFIPGDYEVDDLASASDLLAKMYHFYQFFWNDERLKKANAIQLTPQEITILASIVAAETNHLNDAPGIAGVFINRLKKKQKLQSNPTVFFGIKDDKIPHQFSVCKNIDTPYNTYLYVGLPPGPITIPAEAMIDAVLNYQKHNYFFFVTNEDLTGNTKFAENYAEHKKNAKQYFAAKAQRK